MSFDLDTYVGENFDEVKASGDERIVTCFYCGKRGKLYINVRKKRFHCFRCGAGDGASVLTLLQDHLNVSEKEAWRILKSGDYAGKKTFSYATLFEQQIRKPRLTVLPDEYEPLYPVALHEGSIFAQRAIAYLRKRGLTDADFLLYRIGYCLDGRYGQRIIVPVIENAEVVYFVARLFFGAGTRYLNPAHDEVKANPSTLIYNWDSAKTATTLQLAEGVFDVMGLGDACGGLFGMQLHEGQERLLETGAFESIQLWLDPEVWLDAHQVKIASELAYRLEGFQRPVSICKLAHGDPGELKVKSIPFTQETSGGLAAHFGRKYGIQRRSD